MQRRRCESGACRRPGLQAPGKACCELDTWQGAAPCDRPFLTAAGAATGWGLRIVCTCGHLQQGLLRGRLLPCGWQKDCNCPPFVAPCFPGFRLLCLAHVTCHKSSFFQLLLWHPTTNNAARPATNRRAPLLQHWLAALALGTSTRITPPRHAACAAACQLPRWHSRPAQCWASRGLPQLRDGLRVLPRPRCPHPPAPLPAPRLLPPTALPAGSGVAGGHAQPPRPGAAPAGARCVVLPAPAGTAAAVRTGPHDCLCPSTIVCRHTPVAVPGKKNLDSR